MFSCLLFAYVCMRHTPTRSRATRAVRISLRTRARFHEQHNCPFLAEKYVTIEAALVNCSVPDPLQSTMHPHDSAFMSFRALRRCFLSTKLMRDLRWALLYFLGGVACDVCSCTSQLRCAGSNAANHACTRLHIHAISCFVVNFSCTLLII
jgi:hypothetical protein